MRRIGLFGGTFDPPHVGHLSLARSAHDQLRLDAVLFMPAGTPPHKPGRGMSPIEHRLAMTRLAVRGHAGFRVSTLESRRAGPSYTVDTLAALRKAHPGASLFVLMGADSLDDFPTWHDPQRILELARLAVATRRGNGARARRRLLDRVVWLDNPPVDLSSRDLRSRLRAGRSVHGLVPEAVERYIARHRLYRRSA